eukprot:TRINITY_DN47996_c0_g1_i1.p1 TRINITY_DN47996_c0_g1~~TRINITY_DN47996_c0_g1_i1.p1  ORF type:complete len:345 (+),score=105.79 TRINITY_DN47996_c0_g1_i1:101-1135(+)
MVNDCDDLGGLSDEDESPPGYMTPEEIERENAKIQQQRNLNKRKSVAAESVTNEQISHYVKTVHPKDDATKQAIAAAVQGSEKMQVLCGHIGGEQLEDVVMAFYTQEFEAGSMIIRQGDTGDCLYIIASGEVDIFVQRPGPDGVVDLAYLGEKVVQFGPGALFGELALMYSAPRAATVVASTHVVAWGLNATDFKMLLMQASQSQYVKYEGWLSQVSLLRCLNHYELSQLSDAVEVELYDVGEDIIRQGDAGDKFFILEDGTCAAYIDGESGEQCVKTYTNTGDYFGEIALLTDAPRKATVRATGSGCTVAVLSKETFTNLLGPIQDKLAADVDKYPEYAEFLR